MNDKQFEALLDVFKDIAQEMMFLRDEVTALRDLYGQVHGFESDLEQSERIHQIIKDKTMFDNQQ